MVVKHRTRQLNISGSIYGGRLLSVNQNTSGGIYGGRLPSVNQNTDNIISGKEALSTSTVTAFWQLVVLRENKLSTKLHKFIGNIFGGIGLCPKNGK